MAVVGAEERLGLPAFCPSSFCGREVDLDGYEVEPGLSEGTYKITLSVDGETGPFAGITRIWLNNWSGRIEGQYGSRTAHPEP